MLKIISRPPFDDFSMSLFFSLYARRNQCMIGDGLFMYLWTGSISTKTSVYINFSKIADLNYEIAGYFNLSTNSLKIAGDKRFFNSKDEMFADFLSATGRQESTDKLRSEFDTLYDVYSEQTLNVYETEKLVDDTIMESNKDTVVLFVKDHFRTNISTSWDDPMPEFSRYFTNMCEYYPDKKFVIVTSLENLDKEITCSNCTIVNMGGDITNQISSYMSHTPEIRKEATTNYISLNRGGRYHRLYLISNLYARRLDKMGQISMLSIPDDNIQLNDIMQYDDTHDSNYTFSNQGFVRYLSESKQLNEDEYDIYPKASNDNLTNFRTQLQHKYVNSYVEFVSETSYNEKSFNITEKTLHFIYGCNYPIMISSPGTVKFLRSIGIDMFDDVIDHSYDDIDDPVDRITHAIDSNLSVLTTDLRTLNTRWESDKYRMEQNISFVQNKLANFYKERFWEQIKGLRL